MIPPRIGLYIKGMNFIEKTFDIFLLAINLFWFIEILINIEKF